MRGAFLGTLVACVWAAGSVLPAHAAVSVAGGALVTGTPSSTGLAAMVSSGASIPRYPLEVQATVFLPLVRPGGYAVTGEIRGFTGGGFGGAYVGAGLGFGNFSLDRQTGPVLTVFAGRQIWPQTSVEVRLVKGTRELGTTAGFLGLRFTF